MRGRKMIPVRCLALVAILAAGGTAVAQEWRLWESPADGTEPIDQSQTATSVAGLVYGGHPVGQSFTPREPQLYRLEFDVNNRFDLRPFRVRIWAWNDANGNGLTEDAEYASTVAGPPLWEDVLRVPGPAFRRSVSVFPGIAVVPGEPYYVEFQNDEADGEWGIYFVWSATDRYPDGRVRVAGLFRDPPTSAQYGDLRFATYGAPPAEPAERTCASTGGPAPCFSTPAAWTPPAPPGPPVIAEDYLEMVRSYADSKRAEVLAGPGEYAHLHALLDGFLYEATGDEQYATYAMALLDRSYAWRREHTQDGVSFQWMESAGQAYRSVRDSPSLSEREHRRAKELLLHSQVRYFPGRELGLQNHTIWGALSSKLVTTLVPAEDAVEIGRCRRASRPPQCEDLERVAPLASGTAAVAPDGRCAAALPAGCLGLFGEGEAVSAADHAAWVQFADKVWEEFKTHLDVLEDAAHYEYLDLRLLLQLAELYGERTSIWQQEGFGKLVERLFEHHVPFGPLPVLGDTNGWNEAWAGPAWIHEEAARQLRDGRHRWLAQQLVDYTRRHIQAIEPWRAVYLEYPGLCHAYFAVDPTVAPEPPAGQAEVATAQQVADGSATWSAEAVGQRFVPGASPIVRLDLKLRNGGIGDPATAWIWPWAGTRAATVAGPALYAEPIDFAGSNAWRDVSLFPYLEVEPATSYYLEIRRTAPFAAAGSGASSPEVYAAGELWIDGGAAPGEDLWFRASTLSDGGSVVTERKAQVHLRLSEQGFPPRSKHFGEGTVPDKLVLRSGYEPDGLHAVFNLTAGHYYHGQMETGALVSLVDGGSVLWVDSSYEDRLDKDQNSLQSRRYRGGPFAGADDTVEVTRFADARAATVARFEWSDPRGWAIDHERRVFFVKDRFLWVRDRTAFGGAMHAATGPVWHARDVRSAGVPWAFDTYTREPAGIGGWRFKNPERYALLAFVPRAGAEIVEYEVQTTGNPPSARFVIFQRRLADTVAGERRWFDSILLPHGPETTAAEAAQAITVLFDDGVATALRIVVGDETWTLLDNPDGLPLATGGLSTDAAYLIARTSPGAPPYLLTHEASVVQIAAGPESIDRSWPVRTSVETGGYPEPPVRSGAPPPRADAKADVRNRYPRVPATAR